MNDNQEEVYVTYKFYDSKLRRLAIFGQRNSGIISIYVIACSRKDAFIKKKAREMFEDYKKKQPQFIIPEKDNKPGKTFINFCHDNFYKRKGKVELKCEIPYFIKAGQEILMNRGVQKLIDAQKEVYYG